MEASALLAHSPRPLDRYVFPATLAAIFIGTVPRLSDWDWAGVATAGGDSVPPSPPADPEPGVSLRSPEHAATGIQAAAQSILPQDIMWLLEAVSARLENGRSIAIRHCAAGNRLTWPAVGRPVFPPAGEPTEVR
jgi:hypothetical protein